MPVYLVLLRCTCEKKQERLERICFLVSLQKCSLYSQSRCTLDANVHACLPVCYKKCQRVFSSPGKYVAVSLFFSIVESLLFVCQWCWRFVETSRNGEVSCAPARLFIWRNMRLVLAVNWLQLALTFAMLTLCVLLCLKMPHVLGISKMYGVIQQTVFPRVIPQIVYPVQWTCLPCGRRLFVMHAS